MECFLLGENDNYKFYPNLVCDGRNVCPDDADEKKNIVEKIQKILTA